MFIKFSLYAVLFATGVRAHMVISLPSTWGLSGDLEVPLNNASEDWFCHGQTKDTNVFTTLNAGSSIDVPIVCGEAIDDPENGASICSDDTAAYHGGGGCALSISYNLGPTIDDFKMFSVNVDCPSENTAMITFEIPDDLPTGDAVCAWTWIPDADFAADEMYMNCFNCKVVGGSTGEITTANELSDHLWAVPYPGVSSSGDDRGLYRDVFSNGALEIEVSGTSGNTTTEEPTETETEVQEPTETETPTDTCTGESSCSCDSCCSKRKSQEGRGRRRGKKGGRRGRGRRN